MDVSCPIGAKVCSRPTQMPTTKLGVSAAQVVPGNGGPAHPSRALCRSANGAGAPDVGAAVNHGDALERFSAPSSNDPIT